MKIPQVNCCWKLLPQKTINPFPSTQLSKSQEKTLSWSSVKHESVMQIQNLGYTLYCNKYTNLNVDIFKMLFPERGEWNDWKLVILGSILMSWKIIWYVCMWMTMSDGNDFISIHMSIRSIFVKSIFWIKMTKKLIKKPLL